MTLHALMFGWEYPPVSHGGLGVACYGLVNGLTANGVEISLTLPHGKAVSSNNIHILTPHDTHVHSTVETFIVPSALQPYDSWEQYEKRIATEHFTQRELTDIYGSDLAAAIAYYTEKSIETTKNTKPNVVHTHDWMTYEAGNRAAHYHNVPHIAHIHATELDRTHFNPNDWIFKKEQEGFKNADKIIAVSNYTKQMIVDYYGIKAEKIEVVHNGINVEQKNMIAPKKQSERPMVLFLGRLAQQKGVMHFLEMAAQVHAQQPNVQFVIAGGGELFGELIDRSIELGLQDNVLFAGKVDSQEANMLYKQASVFVMPSLSEPFGLVALEAALHHTPVILSKQSGAGEVLEHCFKVDFWNTSHMADCVLTILREEELAKQLGSHNFDLIQKLSWSNQAKKVKDIYYSLCS